MKLLPTDEQAAHLRATLERANEARTWIAERGHTEGRFGRAALHALTYHEARKRFGLSAQMVVRAYGSVAACFKRDRRRLPRFRRNAAFPYDSRILKIDRNAEQVSIWTLNGRELMPFVWGNRQRILLNEATKIGESDLRSLPDGRWMLNVSVTVDVPEPYEATDWLGVDLGVVNIATDSDGCQAAGGHLNGLRRRHRRVRQRLQAKHTRSARRRLSRRSGRERRFAADVNHRIAKELVRRAKRTGRGIALEDLSGIRDRIRARRPQRGVLHSWSFRQLRDFIAYKAEREGVPVAYIDPRYTSRTCPRCGCCEKRNRPSQARFRCVGCGHSGHADYIAAGNIAGRAAVNWPNVPSAVGSTDKPLRR